LHGEEEMDEEGLSIFDVESAILTGTIIERQKDKEKEEWKYLVRGQTIDGSVITIVAKLSQTSKVLVITIYKEIFLSLRIYQS